MVASKGRNTRDGRPIPFNNSHVIAIVHREPDVQWSEHRITSDDGLITTFAELHTGGDVKSLVRFADGKLATDSEASLRWEGQTLVFRFRGPNFHGVRKLLLSNDGKTMGAGVGTLVSGRIERRSHEKASQDQLGVTGGAFGAAGGKGISFKPCILAITVPVFPELASRTATFN